MKKVLLPILLLLLLLGCAGTAKYALYRAIHNQDADKVEQILAQHDVDLDPPRQPNLVNKPLALACDSGNLEIVKLLVENGADINGLVSYDDPPLIRAASAGHNDIVAYLIEQGADVNLPNVFGTSVFIGLCAGEDLEIVQLAFEHGGKINESYAQTTQTNWGQMYYTAFQFSVMHGSIEIVQFLLDNGGDPSITDSSGKTCIEIAQDAGREDIIKLLE